MVLKDFSPGIHKLHGDVMAAVQADAAPQIDRGRMSCRVVISTPSLDRDRDQVVTKAIDLKDHRANPIVLFNHQRDMPVGLAEDPAGKYTVRTDSAGRLIAETYFYQKNCPDSFKVVGAQAFELVESGVFRGASIGFLPVPGMIEKSQHADGGPVKTYKAVRLVEYSHVWVPSNPECLVEAVHKGLGGRPLAKPLFDMLAPLIPPRPVSAVSGWEGDRHTVRKAAMPDPNDTLTAGAGADPMDPTATPDQDPNAQAPPDHQATRDDAVGTLMATEYHRLCLGEIDYKEFMKNIGTIAKTHGKLRDAGGDPDEDGDDDEDMDEDDDLDPDDLSEDMDLESDPDDNYEEDDEKPGKRKHVLLYTEKSVDAGADLYTVTTKEFDKQSEPHRRINVAVVAKLREGLVLDPDKVNAAMARADATIAKGRGRRDAVVEKGSQYFVPVRRAVQTGLITKAVAKTKAAPAVEDDEISDELAERMARALEGASDELYAITGR